MKLPALAERHGQRAEAREPVAGHDNSKGAWTGRSVAANGHARLVACNPMAMVR
ncbi:hypothetical protein [Sphingorhabdus sp. YGSMI21]|uniref:hypothetical protein n=1 Tax=Sphingorhabdus sp. YGSMI21 TaxID=2077182 RepID=UPI0013DCDD20|nr:hypothetical protein [Sphingorhabdus sp. YGSMI21]